MIKKINYFTNDFSLEFINKIILFIALASLFVRSGNFSILTPKPFEVIFSVLVLLTLVDIVKNKKIKEFYYSVPKNIWLAVFGLTVSSLIGWFVLVFIKNVPMNKEMILEFGRLSISLTTFLLIFFYTRNDKELLKKYFYALISPIIYAVFLFVPNLPSDSLITTAGRFLGFTNNINTISKLLLIPAMFFVVYSLFERGNKYFKVIYIIASAGAIALLIWSSSRGALLALALGLMFSIFLFVAWNFSWKKILDKSIIVIIILFLGFLLTPYSGKQNFLNRSLNADTKQVHYYGIKDESLKEIVKNSFKGDEDVASSNKDGVNVVGAAVGETASNAMSETRMTIWRYSIKQIPKNILGSGPAYNLSYSGTPLSGGAHNSYLQVFFEGGIVAVLSFGYILLKAIQNLKNELEYSFNKFMAAVSVSLFSLLIALMFDANVKLFWFWAILAIAINVKSVNLINNND